jgi:hypothetical protein
MSNRFRRRRPAWAETAYFDLFWIFAIMALAALPLILIMKKSVARGGLAAH